ncbi:MAG: hypothetical protein ACOCVA_07495 [Prolixibacteraceae bacterium]
MYRLIIRLVIAGLGISVFFGSCIMDEYNIDRLNYQDEEWELKVTTPLFTGDLEFRDLINPEAGDTSPDDKYYVQFLPDSVETIPARAIHEPRVFLDKFFFLIADEYRLTEGKIRFEVTNGCPLPLNLQLHFYQGSWGRGDEIVFTPSVFAAAQAEGEFLQPATTVHEMALSAETFGLVHQNRVGFVSWFDRSESLAQSDTLDANYPVKMKVVLSATVKGMKDEDD